MPRTPETPRTPSFTPVPRARRHNGWSPERQQAFIDALEDTGSVARAAKAVGMSPDGAYLLRRAPGGEEFARAWDEALRRGVHVLVHATMDRAIHGVAVPIMYRGQQVSERRVFSEKLAMFHLRNRLPEEFGGPAPARGAHGRFISAKEEEALKAEVATAERHRLNDAARIDLRARLDRIHAHWVGMLKDSPEHMAAYRLLFGPGAPGDPAGGDGAGVHLGRLPPPLSYALVGVALEEERGRLANPKGEDEPPPD